MQRTIETLPEFDRRSKRLRKKFAALGGELNALATALASAPVQGASLGNGLYKIRLGSASKGGAKSGGFRVVTYYVELTAAGDEVVYLVTIYDKSEEATIPKADLLALLGRELPG